MAVGNFEGGFEMQARNGMNGSVVGASATPTPAQEERLDRLEDQIQHILRSMETGGGQPPLVSPQFSGVAPSSSAAPLSFDKGRATFVREKIRERRWREQFLAADLFADPAWDMLLDLYAACYERRQVSVSTLCIAAAVPAPTARRRLKNLTDPRQIGRAYCRDRASPYA